MCIKEKKIKYSYARLKCKKICRKRFCMKKSTINRWLSFMMVIMIVFTSVEMPVVASEVILEKETEYSSEQQASESTEVKDSDDASENELMTDTQVQSEENGSDDVIQISEYEQRLLKQK